MPLIVVFIVKCWEALQGGSSASLKHKPFKRANSSMGDLSLHATGSNKDDLLDAAGSGHVNDKRARKNEGGLTFNPTLQERLLE